MTVYKMKAETGKFGAKSGQANMVVKKTNIKGIFKKLAIILSALVLSIVWLNWSAKNDEKIMKVNYCWDTNGQHYVSPNINCWNK